MKIIKITSIILFAFFSMACSSTSHGENANAQDASQMQKKSKKELAALSKAYFAAGCFWCVEAIFESVRGVEEVVSGYSGGIIPNPTYKLVCSGTLRHAEAVEVYYDPAVVSYATLLKVFFASQDPTTPNRQGNDAGPQYRSIAFYQNAEQKKQIEDYIQQLDASGAYKNPIVTEITAFEKFHRAEEYHQDFERLHPDHGYVQAVSVPRLKRFQAKHPELLKKM